MSSSLMSATSAAISISWWRGSSANIDQLSPGTRRTKPRCICGIRPDLAYAYSRLRRSPRPWQRGPNSPCASLPGSPRVGGSRSALPMVLTTSWTGSGDVTQLVSPSMSTDGGWQASTPHRAGQAYASSTRSAIPRAQRRYGALAFEREHQRTRAPFAKRRAIPATRQRPCLALDCREAGCDPIRPAREAPGSRRQATPRQSRAGASAAARGRSPASAPA